MERRPDKNRNCTTRYNHVTLGDGMEYRVPVISLGSRGVKAVEAMEAFDKAESPLEKARSAEDMFRLSLNLFYSDKTINRLFEYNNISSDHIDGLINAIAGEITEKKNSRGAILTLLSGLRLLQD